MKEVKTYIRLLLSTVLAIIIFQTSEAQTKDSLELYTPYTKVTVSPGKSVIYSIDVINNSKEIRDENITITNIPRSWNYTLTAGGYDIRKIATLPGGKNALTLKIDVPYQEKRETTCFMPKQVKTLFCLSK